ncbi:MAG: GNAT family N-acetyltransferase [Thaumarchaeota archaeon]|nr:GNAT family N-acetyltransferase [Nitrososphaerota archaeon]
MGVETRQEFRRRGYGSIVVSAAVREALKHSRCCSLFVRSDNEQALGLYWALGFKKIGEELWVDLGTGLIP